MPLRSSTGPVPPPVIQQQQQLEEVEEVEMASGMAGHDVCDVAVRIFDPPLWSQRMRAVADVLEQHNVTKVGI